VLDESAIDKQEEAGLHKCAWSLRNWGFCLVEVAVTFVGVRFGTVEICVTCELILCWMRV